MVRQGYAYTEAIIAPEISTKEVMINAAKVMNGNKWKSFCLDLSYLLRAIVAVLLASIVGKICSFLGFSLILSIIAIAILESAIIVYLYIINFTMAHVVFYEDKRTQKFGSTQSEVVETDSFVAEANIENDYTNPVN